MSGAFKGAKRDEVRAALAAAQARLREYERNDAHLRTRRRELEVSLVDTQAREAALQKGIAGQIKRCRCSGTGKIEAPCSLCEDSGEDHVCDEREYDCLTCAPLRALLASPAPEVKP